MAATFILVDMHQQSRNFKADPKFSFISFFSISRNRLTRTFLTLSLICLCYFVRAQSVTGTGTNGNCPASASITATASGFPGTASIGFQLFQGSTQIRPAIVDQTQISNEFTGLPAGTYTIKAVDQNSSATATSANITVSISYVLMALSNALVDIRCLGATTGQITTTVTGGSGTKMYSLSGAVTRAAQTSNVFADLPAGNYTVAVTDGCSQTLTSNSSVGLDTLSVRAIAPLNGIGATYAIPGDCSSALVLKQQSYAVYNSTQGILNAKDFARFTWKYEYPAGSGNLYGAGGVLNAAAVPLNNVTNSSIPMPAGVTAVAKGIQPTNVIIYDECGNSRTFAADFNYTAAVSVSICLNAVSVSSNISGTAAYKPVCLPVNFTFTDNAAPFTVFTSRQTSVQQSMNPGLLPGHSYTATGIDQSNGNVVYSNAALTVPAATAQTATITGISSACESNRSILRVSIRTPTPLEPKIFTITSAPASAGLSLPATYNLTTAGSYYAFPGTFPDGTYTIQFQTDCKAFSLTGTITAHTASLTKLNTVTNCGSFNLTGTATMENYALYELIILPGSTSNPGLTRTFTSTGTSLPFTGLAYGTYNIGIRLIGTTTCTLSSLTTNVAAPASPINITSATGYVCNTSPSTTADLIVDAISNLNSPLYYSIDNGVTYGAAGMKAFTVAYGSDGQVQVKVKDDCGNIASYGGNLIIPPAARATANSTANNASFCEGTPVQLNVNILNATYSWTGPNNFTSSVNSPVMPSFIEANNGTYSVVVTTACGVQSSSVIVNAITLPGVSEMTGNFAVCKNNTTQLTNATPGGNWSSSNGSIATVSNTGLVTGINAASANITYTTAPNANGCTNSTSVVIVVNPLPVGVITGTTSANVGDPAPALTFTGSNGTAPFTFTYRINGGSSITVSTNSGNSISVSQPTNTPGTFKYDLVDMHDNSSTSCGSTQTGSATVTVNAVLPITMMFFDARMQGDVALLSWATAKEVNNDFFELERSADGITFTTIGRVQGSRSSAEKHDYSFMDMAPLNGKNFYRVKQYDIDKKWTVSDIISLRRTGVPGVSVAPNPASGMVKITSPAGIISLIDINGRYLLNGIRTTGNYSLNLTGYPTGVYLIRVTENNGNVSTLRLGVR